MHLRVTEQHLLRRSLRQQTTLFQQLRLLLLPDLGLGSQLPINGSGFLPARPASRCGRLSSFAICSLLPVLPMGLAAGPKANSTRRPLAPIAEPWARLGERTAWLAVAMQTPQEVVRLLLGWLVVWLLGWLVGWLFGWFVCLFVGWLVGVEVGLLAGWLVACLLGCSLWFCWFASWWGCLFDCKVFVLSGWLAGCCVRPVDGNMYGWTACVGCVGCWVQSWQTPHCPAKHNQEPAFKAIGSPVCALACQDLKVRRKWQAGREAADLLAGWRVGG